MSRHNVFRDGKVHICKEMCPTCIFAPGNKMDLRSGRLRDMIDTAKENDTAVVCHESLDFDNAVCRGFFDRHWTTPLQWAARLGYITEVDPANFDNDNDSSNDDKE